MTDSKVFISLDALSGYHQIKMSEEASLITTFLLSSGRYRYTRATMGLTSSEDEWCQRSDVIFEGFEWASKFVDDILIQAPTWSIALPSVVLTRCREHNITMSLKKFKCGSEVTFISAEGVRPALKWWPASGTSHAPPTPLKAAPSLGWLSISPLSSQTWLTPPMHSGSS